ncbi:TVP38/TMEM64 family protein [Anabaena sp. UHCC 0451]|uniref:TVP38/TMEM64 family protein n=1 Tax=Anabaena sp. UHCC 0451 TaxID=2055235 RepID=UPI002B220E2B|nr:TVP38/TMEM64 family protein [Anabaena sp. UHCC 0451]MEA5577774.1 TVP38/TMEM64 family protein [Anabaena sp. UHCC 0451]
MSQPRKRRFSFQIKLLLISSLVVMAIATIQKFNFQELLRTSLIWVESLGSWGVAAFIVIYNIATVLFIPGALLTMSGGVLFGLVWGSIYVVIAATLGATGAFFIGRCLCRKVICRMIENHPQFQAIDKAIAQEGFKIVLLTRLSPILPFNLLNYAFGVTQVSVRDYILGSFGIIPGTVMYVYLGSLVSDLAMLEKPNQFTSPETQIIQWVIRGVGLMATVALTIYLARLAKKSLEDV